MELIYEIRKVNVAIIFRANGRANGKTTEALKEAQKQINEIAHKMSYSHLFPQQLLSCPITATEYCTWNCKKHEVISKNYQTGDGVLKEILADGTHGPAFYVPIAAMKPYLQGSSLGTPLIDEMFCNWPESVPVCECGLEKTGQGGKHSDWCDKGKWLALRGEQ